MLQLVTCESSRYSMAEQAQMAIEGGCRWIELATGDMPIDQVREIALELMPLCRENQAFLVIDNHVELVGELHNHGVHLHRNGMDPGEAREVLGPEAVIGVTVENARQILDLKGTDVDYVTIGPLHSANPNARVYTIDDYKAIVNEIRTKGSEIPVVACGGVTADDVKALMGAGVNGVAIGRAIAEADDPVKATKTIIEELTGR